MKPQKAQLQNVSKHPKPDAIPVLFNPTEYTVSRIAHYADFKVPGLPTPLRQFVRGGGDSLKTELFLDRTTARKTIEDDLADLEKFIEIDAELHAPPVCQFKWGKMEFQGVVTTLSERFMLFDDDGKILRARITIELKRYASADSQLLELKQRSPDRTRVRTLRQGETLFDLAREFYGDPSLWRVIADANDVERPRLVAPGTALIIPSL